MKERPKLAVLGGDRRQDVAARLLSEHGYDIAAWGLEPFLRAPAPAAYRDVLHGAAAVLLPLPLTADGTHLYCPFLPDPPALSAVLDGIVPGVPVLAGRVPSDIVKEAVRRGIPLVDYFEEGTLKIKNAAAAAEGALALAMTALPVTLLGSACAVVGYGRVGRALGGRLRALGASVTVAARSARDLALAGADGLSPMPLASFLAAPPPVHAVFNTVPAVLFDARVLARLPEEVLLLDLASAPGGVDRESARQLGRHVLWALSLPGKTAPVTAGRIIAETALELLRDRGIG